MGAGWLLAAGWAVSFKTPARNTARSNTTVLRPEVIIRVGAAILNKDCSTMQPAIYRPFKAKIFLKHLQLNESLRLAMLR